jgi:hypothetical protein
MGRERGGRWGGSCGASKPHTVEPAASGEGGVRSATAGRERTRRTFRAHYRHTTAAVKAAPAPPPPRHVPAAARAGRGICPARPRRPGRRRAPRAQGGCLAGSAEGWWQRKRATRRMAGEDGRLLVAFAGDRTSVVVGRLCPAPHGAAHPPRSPTSLPPLTHPTGASGSRRAARTPGPQSGHCLHGHGDPPGRREGSRALRAVQSGRPATDTLLASRSHTRPAAPHPFLAPISE